MNQEARDKLVEAALNGTKQAFHHFIDKDSKCAMGVLGVNADAMNIREIREKYDLGRESGPCPFEGTEDAKKECHNFREGNQNGVRESSLVVHLNDVHQLSFLDIARKFPESVESNG